MSVLVRMLCALAALALAIPHAAEARRASRSSAPPKTTQESSAKETRAKINEWTVGLAGGLLEGAPIRFAADIARVVDDGDNLHVLPIVTRGPTENLQALLHLKGVDAAIINTDALEEFKGVDPDIAKKVTYVLNLFPSELHVFVRPEIRSLQDLVGKKVNFNTIGTAAAYSGPIIFDRLGVGVDKTFIPHQNAIEKLRSGEYAALVFVTSKPVDTFVKAKWEPGFKFLNVEYGDKFADYYLPTSLDAKDYPGLIPAGERIRTLSVATALVSFNWPKGSDRYRRVSRLTSYLFDRIQQLHGTGYHPKWQDVNLAASAGQLARFPAAQEWLNQHGAQSAGAAPAGLPAQTEAARRR